MSEGNGSVSSRVNHETLLALASHAAGDFPLQTSRMAEEKFDNPRVRAEHVTVYTATYLPFVSVVEWSNRQRATFLVLIWGTHFLIDTQRWNEVVPIWYDQALHLIALALSVIFTEEVVGNG